MQTKLILYIQFLRSALTYAGPAWLGIAQTHLHKLQVLQNRCLRVIGGYDLFTTIQQMHDDLQILPIHAYLKHLARTLYAFSPANPNPLISFLGDYELILYPHHKMPRYWLR